MDSHILLTRGFPQLVSALVLDTMDEQEGTALISVEIQGNVSWSFLFFFRPLFTYYIFSLLNFAR